MASSDRLAVTLGDVRAIAALDRASAPRTVEGILSAVPIAGTAFHAMYSGSEVATMIPSTIWLPTENATSRVLPGDLAYYKVPGGEHHGFPDDLAELCWFYDRDARPSMADGPVAVNLFGRFIEGWDALASACRAMRASGTQPVLIDAG